MSSPPRWSRTRAEHIPDADARARIERLAWLLDNCIRLPGGYRIGFDGIVGLIPGIGDTITAGMASFIIAEASRMNVPASVLLRMSLNVVVDLLIGIVPVVGDLFDFAFKANLRNLHLLNEHFKAPQRTRRRSRWVVAGIVAALVVGLGVVIALVIALIQLLWTSIAA